MIKEITKEMITLTIEGKEKEYEKGIRFEEIAKEYQEKYDGYICLVNINNSIKELSRNAYKSGILTFYTRKDVVGQKAYVRTAIFIMMKAIYDIIENTELELEKVKVEFSVGAGYYCSCVGDLKVTEELVIKINERMKVLIDEKIDIVKSSHTTEEGIELFKKHGMVDKEALLRFRRGAVVNVYSIEDYYDYYYGRMLPNTSYVKEFKVHSYQTGLMLMLPTIEAPDKLKEPEERHKLFQTLKTSATWTQKMGIGTVGSLNDQICKGKLNELILVQEALQESRIGEIATEIVSKKGVKIILIAGPSSSGKTTFSHRLSIQLRTHGIIPHPIPVDDYFVDREKTPKHKNGEFNFECIEAIDVEQLNKDMADLLAGKLVELPSFNFITGKREYKGKTLQIGADDILVIEGIHALNNKMTYALPSNCKFKVYISALTTLNIDGHNRIPTTDGRLIRRMVRDARTRGASAKRTLGMWSSVRAGEEANIFPYQETADAMFNSALIYELAVLKQFAEPLLFGIEKGEPEYFEARRLLKFLEFFLGVSSENLPKNSIIREFVGGSCFHV